MKVTLKGGSVLELESGKSIYDIAKGISDGLARAAVAGEVNGEIILQHQAITAKFRRVNAI